jgi:hypothetical protein
MMSLIGVYSVAWQFLYFKSDDISKKWILIKNFVKPMTQTSAKFLIKFLCFANFPSFVKTSNPSPRRSQRRIYLLPSGWKWLLVLFPLIGRNGSNNSRRSGSGIASQTIK